MLNKLDHPPHFFEKGMQAQALIYLSRGGGGGEGGHSTKFSVGVCRPVRQILTQFQTKTCHFPHPFSDLAPKIKTHLGTFVLP